ncbi:MAG: DUF4340 domain-containing protein [Verrucomicrobiaceae bacterium]|nr:DUF4340 domain-containing protein [Verrucomicrobiaceae bacterium]
MRITTTAILAGTVILLAILTHFVDREPAAGERAAARANVLLRLDLAGLERIEIEKAGDKTALTHRGGFWFFTEPQEDRVDADVIQSLLDTLNHLRILDTISGEKDGMSDEQIGLSGDTAIRVTLTGKAGKRGREISETIVLGLESPRTDSLYARREGDGGGTFVVAGNPRPLLEDPLLALRDRRVLGAPVEAIVELVLRQSDGQIALQRRVTPPLQDWTLTEPLRSWANREALDQLFTDIAALRIEEVVADGVADDPVPNPLPETAAVLQFQVYGVETPLTVYLKELEPGGEGPLPLLEVRASDRPLVYRLRSDLLTKLPDSANDLRDRTLARIPMEYLDTITVQSRIDPLVYLKSDRSAENPTWTVKLNNKLIPANAAEVASLVNAVNDAAILEFTSDSAENLAEYGLNPPARRVIFNLVFPGAPLEDGRPGQVQHLARVLNLGWLEGEKERVYANFDGEPYVYQLDPTFVNHIPTHPIKWRSLNVLTFSPMHLKSITRELPGKENLTLLYDYRRDRWEASRSGVDLTRSLDIPSARRLRDRLGALTASGWYLSLGPAYQALETPSAEFKIVTTELDRATNQPREVTQMLTFAPASTNVYFGRIEGSPDVFFLDHETYRDLIRPVTTARISNP